MKKRRSVREILDDDKPQVKFEATPGWLRIVGWISAIMYVLFIGAYVFGSYKYVIVEYLFLSGAPIYVSWISNLLVAWIFKKQRKLTGFIVLELISMVLFGVLVLVLWLVQGNTGDAVNIMIGLFTVTLVANMIIYPLVTFPRKLMVGNTEVVGSGNTVEY